MAVRLKAWGPLLAAGIVSAWGGGDATPGATVRDSAGVAIVENHALPAPDTARWRVHPEPAVSIGVTEGEEAYLFQSIQEVARLSDGRIVVADLGSSQLRYYDADGRHLRSSGREGDGPGEFRFLDGFFVLPGDSLLVLSGNTSTLYSLFDGRGDFVRVLRNAATFARPHGRFPNGDLLFYLYARSIPPGSVGHVRDSVLLVVEPAPVLAAGDDVPAGVAAEPVPRPSALAVESDTILRIPGNEEFRQAHDRGIANDDRPFGRRVEVAARGDRVAVAVGTDADVRVYRRDGSLDRIIRFTAAREPLVQDEVDAWKAWRRDVTRTPEQRQIADEFIAAQSFPEQRPLSSAVLIDTDGWIWLERYRWDPAAPQRWYVLDAEGRAAGAVDLPPGLRVHEIGRDYVLAVARDELGVERVVLYRLVRPDP